MAAASAAPNMGPNQNTGCWCAKVPEIPAHCATSAGPKEREGLMEQPSIGSRKRWATITDIAMGNTPSGPAPSVGISTVDSTLNIKSIVPRASANHTCPPLKTASSYEFEPNALAAGQLLPNIDHRNRAPKTDPSICDRV